ncbi:hypothetical protein AArcMg_1797 [Natrarchaeobaculum sulfurireducens]|uniref:Uncharacterized protein n=1 Tax=Natrarchaeobaculum sulfurireducens TaxID=2044521 RepID=A0A346PQL0_9EURY|nr:hypothetical protein AArcMg_1797 [Natrarchaeobaculum sulfurireducens]
MRQYIEIGADGINFISETQSLFDDEPVPTTTDTIEFDELPVENIRINNITRLEAVEGENGPESVRLEFETAERLNDNNVDENVAEGDFFERLEAETGIGFDQRKNEFVFDESKSDKKNFVGFIEFLFDEGYITEDDLPYSTPRSRKSYLINTEPKNQEGGEMQRVGKPKEGIYVPTYYGQEQKQNYMKLLVNDFVKGHHIN